MSGHPTGLLDLLRQLIAWRASVAYSAKFCTSATVRQQHATIAPGHAVLLPLILWLRQGPDHANNRLDVTGRPSRDEHVRVSFTWLDVADRW